MRVSAFFVILTYTQTIKGSFVKARISKLLILEKPCSAHSHIPWSISWLMDLHDKYAIVLAVKSQNNSVFVENLVWTVLKQYTSDNHRSVLASFNIKLAENDSELALTNECKLQDPVFPRESVGKTLTETHAETIIKNHRPSAGHRHPSYCEIP